MYSARITRANPAAFVILIDQSGSMQERVVFNSESMSKAEAVALVTNMLIEELINRSRREEGVRDYFDIAVLGYSGDQVKPMIGGTKGFTKCSVLAAMPTPKRAFTRERVLPNGMTSLTTIEQRFWVEPRADGNTPMYGALETALEMLQQWCLKPSNRASYPPVLFNITDGEASDAEPEKLLETAEKIKLLSTEDGNVLFFNIHICTESGISTLFPSSHEGVSSVRYGELLYRMSSRMPEKYNMDILRINGGIDTPPFRAFSYNSSINDLVAMLNIGSISLSMIQ